MANSVGVFFLLLIFAEFSGIDSLSTSNYTNSSASESPTNNRTSNYTNSSASESPTSTSAKQNHTQRCLETLTEIEGVLSSKVPPLKGRITDNYHNISRALFPALNLPSLYIKITLQFINETGTGIKKIVKFTWSESYVFVSVKQTCLAAMTVFSLGTVYPQRRQTELVLTVPPLCDGASKENGFEDDNEVWRYVLLTLQDIAIIPNVSDPQVNTAQCVVIGHEGDANQPIDYPASVADWYNYKSCWILPVSILFTIAISWYAHNWVEQTDKTNYWFKAVSVSVFYLFIIMGMMSVISIVVFIVETAQHYVTTCQKIYSSHLHFILFWISLMVVNVIVIPCCTNGFECECEERCECGRSGFPVSGIWVMFPCIYQIVHHLLWVLCAGIPADPSWAVPLFLCECLAMLTLVCAIYMYYKKNITSGTWAVCTHLVISVVAIWLGIFTVVISFYSRSTAVSTESFLEIIMAAVLLWAIKNSGLYPIETVTIKSTSESADTPSKRGSQEEGKETPV